MDDYISKPVKTEDLAMLLQRWTPTVPGGESNAHDDELRDDIAVLDAEKLRELDGLTNIGEPSLIVEMVDLFRADAHPRLAELKDALNANDFHRIAKVAHALKGSGSHFGARHFCELCAQIEKQGREQQREGLAETALLVEKELARLERALLIERQKRAEIKSDNS
jgi:HPt (histidine-containing phosphotransfer) domain-containing protein